MFSNLIFQVFVSKWLRFSTEWECCTWRPRSGLQPNPLAAIAHLQNTAIKSVCFHYWPAQMVTTSVDTILCLFPFAWFPVCPTKSLAQGEVSIGSRQERWGSRWRKSTVEMWGGEEFQCHGWIFQLCRWGRRGWTSCCKAEKLWRAMVFLWVLRIKGWVPKMVLSIMRLCTYNSHLSRLVTKTKRFVKKQAFNGSVLTVCNWPRGLRCGFLSPWVTLTQKHQSNWLTEKTSREYVWVLYCGSNKIIIHETTNNLKCLTYNCRTKNRLSFKIRPPNTDWLIHGL